MCRTVWCDHRNQGGCVICETCLTPLLESPVEAEVFDRWAEHDYEAETAVARVIALSTVKSKSSFEQKAECSEPQTCAGKRARCEVEDESLSAYELERQENIKRNYEVLEKLGLVAPLGLAVERETRETNGRRRKRPRVEVVGDERSTYVLQSIAYAGGEIYPIPTARLDGLSLRGFNAGLSSLSLLPPATTLSPPLHLWSTPW